MPPKTNTPRMAKGAIQNMRRARCFLYIIKKYLRFDNLMIQFFQLFAQVEHSISLTADQGADFFSGALSDFLKGNFFQLVPDKNLTLFFGQLFERCKKF